MAAVESIMHPNKTLKNWDWLKALTSVYRMRVG